MRRALIVGIDHYEQKGLATCEDDATRVAEMLERNADTGKINFHTKLVLSTSEITWKSLQADIKKLFSGPAEIALLYFAGHGSFDNDTSSGFLVTPDREDVGQGIALDDIITLATKANKDNGVMSTVIILDCCRSGNAGELRHTNSSLLGNGMTILTSCDRHQVSESSEHGGIFTNLLLDALEGAAADIRGNITLASVYSHIDQALGEWEQRPIYKANVQKFLPVRTVPPKVPEETLSQFIEWFPTADHIFQFDPSFEPDRKNVPEDYRHLPISEANTEIFKRLQNCNRYGLVTPVEADHMYDAAMSSTGCRLTALGRHYRNMVVSKII